MSTLAHSNPVLKFVFVKSHIIKLQRAVVASFHNTNKALVFITSFDPCLAFVNRKCGVSGKEWTIKTMDSVIKQYSNDTLKGP